MERDDSLRGKVWFVGAGPGDPELITVKGRRLLENAEVVVWAGSLVNPLVLRYVPPGAATHDSSSLTLPEIVDLLQQAVNAGQVVVRLHSGDPSLYGAIQEQIDELQRLGIANEIVPGVSSFAAAAAAIGREYTAPGVSQTVILCRMEGKTPVPAAESLADLARHRASMVVFLSIHRIQAVVEELKKAYPVDTPVAIVYKVSWPEEKVIRGTLGDIVEKAAPCGIKSSALILVGQFLSDESGRENSRLYSPEFSHRYRPAAREAQA